MRSSLRSVVFAFGSALLGLACSGKFSREHASEPVPPPREPAHHRPSSDTCPSARGSADNTSKQSCMKGDLVDCLVDGDCASGVNPRCSFAPPFACVSSCTTDQCFSDAECESNQPCLCRANDADPSANYCDTESGCRVDADCGPGGYCSPSLVGAFCTCTSAAYCDPPCPNDGCVCGDSCDHGYFCHTPRDTCVDDTDCKQGESCALDKVEKRFSCQQCWPIP